MNIKTTLTDKEINDLGFKSGLEIHQQLEGRKLFSPAPTTIRDDEPLFTIERFLRLSAGESGQVDVAALHEHTKKQRFMYQGYEETSLVELDEQPPAAVSPQAVTSSLQIAKFLDMTVVDQIRFMRKIVINGSNTSGFQRTGLIAQNGTLQTTQGIVGIESLCLEEDSCKEVEKKEGLVIFNLSRLGIPLLEIATAPDIISPTHVQETASQLGLLLRSLPTVKRGLGTIRQDVNISIAKGTRVEIKGAQDLKLLPELARNEALRQHNLLEIFSELQKRNACVGEPQELTSLKHSSSKVVQQAKGSVYGVKLSGFKGLLGIEIQPERRFGSELSDYAKQQGVKGLFHSDELPKYGITQEETDAVFSELGCGEQDGFILIAAPKEQALRALDVACQRAKDFSLRKEVRMAKPNGSTSFLRPMPGAGRMYPETDVRPFVPDLDAITLPELLSDKIERLAKEYSLDQAIVKKLLRDGYDLETLTTRYQSFKPTFLVDVLYRTHTLQEQTLLLEKLNEGLLLKDSLEEIIPLLEKGTSVDFNQFKPVSLDDIKKELDVLRKEMHDAPLGAVIGQAMRLYKGRVDGKELSAYIRKLFETK